MPVSATTNTAAIAAQRSIAVSSDQNARAMAELATGSRISRASDAAAEAAIGAKIRSTVGVLTQASRNTSQGASLIQVATDALKNISTVLTRLKALTAQVINGSLSDADKMMAREEFLKLKDLTNNIATQTRWNGVSMLSGGSGNASLARGSVHITNAPAGAVGTFATLASTELTGAINGKVSSVTVSDYNSTTGGGVGGVLSANAISVTMQNGEIFTNQGVVNTTDNGTFTLTSTSNSNNTMTLTFGSNVIGAATIVSATTFQSALAAVFQGATFGGGAAQSVGSSVSVVGGAASTNAFIATVSATDGIDAKVTTVYVNPAAASPYAIGDIIVTLSDGSVYSNTGNGGATGAFTAATDANLVLGNTADATKKITLTQASSIAGITSAATLQSTLATTLAGVSIHGTTSWGSIAANGLNTDTTYGFTPDVRGSSGFIFGSATNASVSRDGNQFKVSVTIGNQTFVNTVAAPTDYGSLKLISVTDPANQLVLEFGSSVTTAMTNETTFNAGLRNFLGLQYATAPAQFSPDSGATGDTTGINAILVGSSAPAGKYAMNYQADSSGISGTMKLTDGVNVYYERIETGGEQKISFANGITICLGDSFAVNTSLSQRTFDVTAGDAMTFDFQIAETAQDILTVQLSSASLEALGLTNVDMNTLEAAQRASFLIEEALSSVNQSYAKLGAQQKQLEVNKDVLSSNITNMLSALSEFVDSDVPEAMTRMTSSSVQYQIASAMLVQSNERTQQLLSMTR